jgi:hypothetical protein
MPRQKGHPKTGGRRKGTPNKATRAWKDFVAELVSDPARQEQLAEAIAERPDLMFKAAEHAVGKPRQTLEVASTDRWTWIPPARADGPISVPAHMLVLPRGAHIHGADVDDREGEIHCHLCHENWAARVDEKNQCPRCEKHPEERTDKDYP